MEREEMAGTTPFWYEAEATRLKVELIKANERIKALEDALRSMLEVCKDPRSYDFVKVTEIIRAALEVK